MYVLPKSLESLWVAARGKGLVFRTGKWGDAILAALGMAMVMVNGFTFFSFKSKGKKKKQMPTFFLFLSNTEHVSERSSTSFGIG